VPTFDAMPSGLDPSIHHTTCHPAICPHDVSASFAPIHIFCLSFSFFFFFLNMFFPNLNVPNNSSLLASSYLPIAAHCQRIQRCAINLILKFIFQKKLKKKKKKFSSFCCKKRAMPLFLHMELWKKAKLLYTTFVIVKKRGHPPKFDWRGTLTNFEHNKVISSTIKR
jgi:hypothetical protein